MLLHFNLQCRAQTNMQRLSIVCFSVCSLVNIHCCLFHLVCLVHKGCSNKMPHLARSRMAQHRDVGDKMFVFLKSRLYALREAHTHWSWKTTGSINICTCMFFFSMMSSTTKRSSGKNKGIHARLA